MLDLIRATARKGPAELLDEFQTARPFRHLAIGDFLPAELSRELMAHFPAFDREHALDEAGDVRRKAVFTNLPQLGSAYRRLDIMLRAAISDPHRLTGIPGLLYDPDYIGGGTHENLEGQDLDPHVDFETSETSWHGFRRIHFPPEKKGLTRRSIAVYYYTRRRPAHKIAPDHSTIYVPRRLPEHIRPGRILTELDLEAVLALLVRRDMQIRFLYEREKDISQVLNRILHTNAFRLYKTLISPGRNYWRRIKARIGS